jgi:hypothetical protein
MFNLYQANTARKYAKSLIGFECNPLIQIQTIL